MLDPAYIKYKVWQIFIWSVGFHYLENIIIMEGPKISTWTWNRLFEKVEPHQSRHIVLQCLLFLSTWVLPAPFKRSQLPKCLDLRDSVRPSSMSGLERPRPSSHCVPQCFFNNSTCAAQCAPDARTDFNTCFDATVEHCATAVQIDLNRCLQVDLNRSSFFCLHWH